MPTRSCACRSWPRARSARGAIRCRPRRADHERISALDANASRPQEMSGRSAVFVREAMSSSGFPLDASTRHDLEARLGHELAAVRVHADSRSGASAKAIGAAAYTAGAHVVFADGKYTPETASGARLLAHELVHVVQQGGSRSSHGHNATTVQRTPDDTWIGRMQELQRARPMTDAQKHDFVKGLNEVIHHNARSTELGVVLPVELYPGHAELKPGHVYFDPALLDRPAKTSRLCRAGTRTGTTSVNCGIENDMGDGSLLGRRRSRRQRLTPSRSSSTRSSTIT